VPKFIKIDRGLTKLLEKKFGADFGATSVCIRFNTRCII